MSRTRTLIATLIAPLSAPVANFIYPILSSGGEWPYNETDYLLIIGVSTICAYVALFFIGLPIYWLLKRLRKLSNFTLSAAGAASGAFVFVLILYVLGPMHAPSPDAILVAMAWGAILGLLVALTFGLIAGTSNVRDRPYSA